jgi:hypothetical protein
MISMGKKKICFQGTCIIGDILNEALKNFNSGLSICLSVQRQIMLSFLSKTLDMPD